MAQLISETRPKARKQYQCDACSVFNERGELKDLTIDEKDDYLKAQANDYMILPGETYIKQIVKDDVIGTFRAIPAIFDICVKYDLFDE